MATDAERQRLRRQKLREKGLVKLELWVRPEFRQPLREAAGRLEAEPATPSAEGRHGATTKRRSSMTEQTVYQLRDRLAQAEAINSGQILLDLVEGTEPVLRAVVQNRDEFPVYLNIAGEQILAITYLWHEDDVEPAERPALHDALLRANLPIPLSAFSIIDKDYVLFGALAENSAMDDVITEILTLSDNTLDALEGVRGYLKQGA